MSLKKLPLCVATLAMALLVAGPAAAADNAPRKTSAESMRMIVETPSPHDANTTIELIKEAARERNWKVPIVQDFQEVLRKEGKPDVGKVYVMRMCQPEKAYEVLSDDDRKFLSVMMPCAISVYEKADGKTYIAMINVGLMKQIYGDMMPDVMVEVEADMKSFLSHALHSKPKT